MQVPCLKRKHNMVAGADGNTPLVVGRYLNTMMILRDTYSDTASSTRCHVLALAR